MTPQSDVRLETGLACGQILYYGGGEVSARHNRVLLTLPVQPVCVAVLTYNLPSFPPSLPPTNTVRLESGSGGGAVCSLYGTFCTTNGKQMCFLSTYSSSNYNFIFYVFKYRDSTEYILVKAQSHDKKHEF